MCSSFTVHTLITHAMYFVCRVPHFCVCLQASINTRPDLEDLSKWINLPVSFVVAIDLIVQHIKDLLNDQVAVHSPVGINSFSTSFSGDSSPASPRRNPPGDGHFKTPHWVVAPRFPVCTCILSQRKKYFTCIPKTIYKNVCGILLWDD